LRDPSFIGSEELDSAFSSGEVADRSVFLRPSDIGVLPDEDEHYVVFADTLGEAFLCSRKPLAVRSTPFSEMFESVLYRASSPPGVIDPHPKGPGFLEELLERMETAYEATLKRPLRRLERRRLPLEEHQLQIEAHVRNISRTYFGCELLLV